MTSYEKDLNEIVKRLTNVLTDYIKVITLINAKLDKYDNYKNKFKVIK